MRIIAGEHRGRRILPPADQRTRPITDRVKTSLFDRLAQGGRVRGATVLDLFSGTGSMGLECLSRGARRVVFVERDREARRRLGRNLEMINGSDSARVLRADALSAGMIDALDGESVTLLFMDPPYRMLHDKRRAVKVFEQIARLASLCAEDAVLVLRTDSHAQASAVCGWSGPEQYHYGSMTLHWYDHSPR